MPYSHVVFDFDGTLVDSLANSIAAFRRIAPRFKLNLDLDLATARTTPTRDLFRQMGVSFWKLPRLIRAFQEEAAQDAPNLKLFDGIADVLAAFASRGVRLGILSSNREDAIRACLRANGVEDRFAFVVGYPKLFGKAKALRRILKAEKIDRESFLYVGDEARDVQAAKKAKVASAAVTWGFHAEPLLVAAEPKYLVRSPAELLDARFRFPLHAPDDPLCSRPNRGTDMRRMLYTLAVVSLVAGAGCHRDKYNLSAKFEEDYVLPPDEARFNNPPESGYKKSSKKRESDVRDAPGGLSGGAGRNGAGFNSNGVPGGGR